jgi:hypothetical protein
MITPITPNELSGADVYVGIDPGAVAACTALHPAKPDGIQTDGVTRGSKLFIKGPIPLAWLQQANGLGGSTGIVANGLWFYAGINKSRRFRIDRRLDQICCVTRQTRNIALERLKTRGLITIYPKRGGYPTIEILDTKQ